MLVSLVLALLVSTTADTALLPAKTADRCPIPHVSPRQIGSSFGLDQRATDIFDIAVVLETSPEPSALGWLYTTGDGSLFFEPRLHFVNTERGLSITPFASVGDETHPDPGTAVRSATLSGTEIARAIRTIAKLHGASVTDRDLPSTFSQTNLTAAQLMLQPCFSKPWVPKPDEVR